MLYIIEMLITLLYLPFKFKSLNIFLHKWIAYLYFYECQVRCGFNGMEMFYGDVHHITALNFFAFAIQHKDSFTFHASPYLAAMMVQLIAYVLACIEVYFFVNERVPSSYSALSNTRYVP